MPGEFLKSKDGGPFGNGWVHINYGRGSRKKLCKFCGQVYRDGRQCDYPIENGKTCDAEMCDSCTRTLGRQDTHVGGGLYRMGDTIDVCPNHREVAVMKDGKLQAEQGELF